MNCLWQKFRGSAAFFSLHVWIVRRLDCWKSDESSRFCWLVSLYGHVLPNVEMTELGMNFALI